MQNIYFVTTPDSKLSKQKESILKVLESEIINLRKVYNFDKFFNITIYNMPHMTIPDQGCGGYTPSAEWMQLLVDEENKIFGTEEFLTHLKNTLVHEFNHTVRWSHPSYGYTLIESIISEGIATAFEKDYLKMDVDWGHYTQENIVRFFEIIKEVGKDGLEQTGDHSAYIFGNESIPKFFGYRLGTYIIDEFRKNNPNLSWEEITKMSHEKILELSKVELF